jgi:hypothetical protein
MDFSQNVEDDCSEKVKSGFFDNGDDHSMGSFDHPALQEYAMNKAINCFCCQQIDLSAFSVLD